MGAFFVCYRWLTAALVVVLVFVIIFGLRSQWIGAAPLDAPLTMSPPGQVETDVRVRLACPHRLNLYLPSKTRTREEMRRLVGRYGTTEGVEIPLRWSFRDATGLVLALGEAENEGYYASATKPLSVKSGEDQKATAARRNRQTAARAG